MVIETLICIALKNISVLLTMKGLKISFSLSRIRMHMVVCWSCHGEAARHWTWEMATLVSSFKMATLWSFLDMHKEMGTESVLDNAPGKFCLPQSKVRRHEASSHEFSLTMSGV